jgi:hypothetical protein
MRRDNFLNRSLNGMCNEIRRGILRRSYEKRGRGREVGGRRGLSTTCQKEEDERMSAVKTHK